MGKNRPNSGGAAVADPTGDPSAKPGTKEEKAKKEKRVRIDYPVPEGGLDSWPTDFDAKVHKPLKRKDFKDETLWLEAKAAEYEKRASAMRDEIETCKTLGNAKDRARAKKLLSMQKRMAEMEAELKGEGVDVDNLLEKLKKRKEAEASAKA